MDSTCSAGALMTANRKRIADFALKSRLPSVYSSRESVDAGGLMYYGADLRTATGASLLRGQNSEGSQARRSAGGAADEFELVINLKTAKQIGLTIPPKVLARADKVIK